MPSAANHGAPHSVAAITHRLSSTGVAAGTAKRRHVFRMPAASDTIEISAMYGNITRVIHTASSKRGRPEATSQTTAGAAATPTTTVASSVQPSTVATASTN